MNHYYKCCRSKEVHNLQEVEDSDPESSESESPTADGLLFKGTRLIVPKALKPEMLRQIHKSHLGIVKCRQRAREVLFWPGMSLDIEQMITNCSVCAEYAKKQPSEPLKPTNLEEDRNRPVRMLRRTQSTLCHRRWNL